MNQLADPPYCWDVAVALFYPYLGVFPMVLPIKDFNEATSRDHGEVELG